MLVKKLSFFSVCLGLFIGSAHADIVRRAALDVGSGACKILIADVDTDTQKITSVHFKEFQTLELRKDLLASTDGCVSPMMEEQLVNLLKDWKRKNSHLEAKEWKGVGTSVFRKAKNGQALLDRIKKETGIEILLVPQEEEGEIGFKSAVAYTGLDPENVITWDNGSGSFQITTLIQGKLEMYGTEFAVSPAIEALFTKIRKEKFLNQTPNPISQEEAEALITVIREKLPPVPEWIAANNKTVVHIRSSYYDMATQAVGKSSFSQKELWDTIVTLMGKTDEELSAFLEPSNVVASALFLYTVMNHCGFENIVYAPTTGSCDGLLIMPHYWK
jgi:exopolyphosphatase / guanosine-5'-triphosphate,3'-diphosphate pyrophosphatase